MDMAKETPRRMMRDAAGKEYPARQVRSFWIEEPTYKAFQKLAAANRQAVVDQVRQLMREATDKQGNGKKAG